MRRTTFAALALSSLALLALGPAIGSCSIGAGNGSVTGVLNVSDCWSGAFNLQPDFFAAVPYRSSLQLRIQNGGDYQTFSDGISLLIDDFRRFQADSDAGPSLLHRVLRVGLPPGVTPPGVPITPDPDPPPVHLALYLQRSCQIQSVALYAVDAVTLNAQGSCDRLDGGDPVVRCPRDGTPPPPLADGGESSSDASAAPPLTEAGAPSGEAGAPTSGGVGRSTITIDALFDGDVDEASAEKRLNQGSFHVYLADPREVCPGGLGPPPPCRGELVGRFKFYFERGKPAQPFP